MRAEGPWTRGPRPASPLPRRWFSGKTPTRRREGRPWLRTPASRRPSRAGSRASSPSRAPSPSSSSSRSRCGCLPSSSRPAPTGSARRPAARSRAATTRSHAGLSFTDRLMELFLAPVNGLYGVKATDGGFIGPYETGELFGAAGVFLFVIAIGIFITMSMQTGAIDNGIARVAQAVRARAGAVLIVVLMVLFSIGGTTEGMAEETLGFYALVVPLMLSLGYDRMVAAGHDPDRRRHRRARLDGEPVRHRRRLRRGRHLDRRRHRLPVPDVPRAGAGRRSGSCSATPGRSRPTRRPSVTGPQAGRRGDRQPRASGESPDDDRPSRRSCWPSSRSRSRS